MEILNVIEPKDFAFIIVLFTVLSFVSIIYIVVNVDDRNIKLSVLFSIALGIVSMIAITFVIKSDLNTYHQVTIEDGYVIDATQYEVTKVQGELYTLKVLEVE